MTGAATQAVSTSTAAVGRIRNEIFTTLDPLPSALLVFVIPASSLVFKAGDVEGVRVLTTATLLLGGQDVGGRRSPVGDKAPGGTAGDADMAARPGPAAAGAAAAAARLRASDVVLMVNLGRLALLEASLFRPLVATWVRRVGTPFPFS